MRYMKPHYYDRFKCVADQCPATCCAGWQIVIDEDTLERYAGEKGAFGNRLKNSVDWEEGVFFQYGGRCAFLNENDLCDLQSELGEKALCETCRRYPRHVEEYEGLREYSLSLSCPAAARIMLEERDKTKFLEWETDEEDDFEEFDFLMFTQLEDAREVLFGIVQNRGVDFDIRMKKILEFAGELQECVDEERCFDVDAVTEKYRQWNTSEWRERKRKTRCRADREENSYADRIKEFPVFCKLEHLNRDWTGRLDSTWNLLYERGETYYQDISERFAVGYGYRSENCAEWERIGEQLLMFFVYTYFCGAVYDDRIYTKIALSVFSVRWIQEFYMALWTMRQGEAEMEELVETAYSYAREVEHSDLNLDILEDWLEKNRIKFSRADIRTEGPEEPEA